MGNKRIVTFFGGAMNNTETKEYKETIQIGQLLSNYFGLLFCGGYRGLMEAVCKGFEKDKVGVTCETFGSTKGNAYLDHTIIANDIYARLRSLVKPAADTADLYILQTGGIGTLSELFLVLDVLRKENPPHPKVVLYGTFWEFLYDMPPHIVDVITVNCVHLGTLEQLKDFLDDFYGAT